MSLSSSVASVVAPIVAAVFGDDVEPASVENIDGGRGVFSHVVRCRLQSQDSSRELPKTVAIKWLRDNANGASAMSSGAASREVLAYERLLPATPTVSAPRCFGVGADSRGRPALVLEDLSEERWSDQLDGLSPHDLRLVTAELICLHEQWAGAAELDTLEVRRSTPSNLPVEGIANGLRALEGWDVAPDHVEALQRLADVRTAAVAAFVGEKAPTLCHGDPRADNVAFRHNRAVLFDWQQLAVQFGESDLAWLLATSATPDVRRQVESDIVASYALARNQDAATTWRRYAVGMVLPGLAVLFLAQRTADDERTQRFIATSVQRIAIAVDDLGVADVVSS